MDPRHSASALCAAIGLALLACMPKPPAPQHPPPPQPTVRAATTAATTSAAATATAATDVDPPEKAHRFAVVSENEAAAAVAMTILKKGGSAADAAIAAALAAGVAQPVSSGIGGGGFGLYWDQTSRKVTAIDFRETAPMGIRDNEHASRPPRAARGVMIGVPGEIAGLEWLHRRFGKLPRGELYRAAADLADGGFALSHHMHRALRWNEGWIRSSMATVFAPSGELLSRGQVTSNPALAKTLRQIASEGADAFYRGGIAADLVNAARARGSRLSLGDMDRYAPQIREPLTTRWEGVDVYTMPPPSGGSITLAQTLLMHDAASLRRHGYGSGAYLHLLAETFRGSISDRMRAIGDPAYIKMDMPLVLSRARLKDRRRRMSLDRTRTFRAYRLDDSGTSNIITVDATGNVAVITTSISGMFGAQVTTRGFTLNNTLASFSMGRDERRFGAVRRPNAPKGGARPVSSMTPVIVVRDGRAVLALGASGGSRIPAAVTQGLLAKLVFGRSAAQCSGDVRIDTPPSGGLRIDPSAPEELVADLRKRGGVVDAEVPNYGALGIVIIDDDAGRRQMDAAVDPRKGGAALVE